MTEEEKNKILSQKKGLDSNRYLALALCVLLAYWIFFKNKDTPRPVPYYIIMGIILLAALGIVVRDTILISRLDKKLKETEISADAEEQNQSEQPEE